MALFLYFLFDSLADDHLFWLPYLGRMVDHCTWSSTSMADASELDLTYLGRWTVLVLHVCPFRHTNIVATVPLRAWDFGFTASCDGVGYRRAVTASDFDKLRLAIRNTYTIG